MHTNGKCNIRLFYSNVGNPGPPYWMRTQTVKMPLSKTLKAVQINTLSSSVQILYKH